jgi:hypothetical protein
VLRQLYGNSQQELHSKKFLHRDRRKNLQAVHHPSNSKKEAQEQRGRAAEDRIGKGIPRIRVSETVALTSA